MGSPCKLLRLSGALPPGLGGFRSTTAGGSTGASGHCLARRRVRDRAEERGVEGFRTPANEGDSANIPEHPRRAALQVALLARPFAGAPRPLTPYTSLCTAPAQ